jgi:tRNA G18 (ribose-2'-O)-methylase SpoU
MTTTFNKPKNVHDFLQNLSVPEIKDYCKLKTINASVLMTGTEGDFNFGTVVRNANFFGFKEVFYIGKKSFDKRAAVGANHYTPITYFKDIEGFIDYHMHYNEPYQLIALENNVNFPMESIYTFEWPSNPLIVIGEEKNGIPEKLLTYCNKIVTIPTEGCIRSLNAGTASGIAMALIRQNINKT